MSQNQKQYNYPLCKFCHILDGFNIFAFARYVMFVPNMIIAGKRDLCKITGYTT